MIKARAELPRGTYRSQAEERYAWELEVLLREGKITSWKYEPITFKLGGDTRYTPDFMVIHTDGSIEFKEVKGFMRPAARVKIRVAASMYRAFNFTIVWASQGRRLTPARFTEEKVQP